jgi:hypothetical protein
MKKWDDFRARRQSAIDNYIMVKRKQKSNELLLRLLYLHKTMKIAYLLIPKYKEYREI